MRFYEKLGSGAYKDVYRAYDTIEGIEVAWNLVTLAGIPKSEKARHNTGPEGQPIARPRAREEVRCFW